MQITDPIADLLTRIRNANSAKHDTVEIPASNTKKSICQILVDEGFIKSFTVADDGKQRAGTGLGEGAVGLGRVARADCCDLGCAHALFIILAGGEGEGGGGQQDAQAEE